MYDKVCTVCGKPFQAVNSRYCICSPECRKKRDREIKKRDAKGRYEANKNYLKKYYREHYVPVTKKCECCGADLPDGRQSFCLRCLVYNFMNGEGVVRRKAYSRLALRGYTKSDIISEAKSLNLV